MGRTVEEPAIRESDDGDLASRSPFLVLLLLVIPLGLTEPVVEGGAGSFGLFDDDPPWWALPAADAFWLFLAFLFTTKPDLRRPRAAWAEGSARWWIVGGAMVVTLDIVNVAVRRNAPGLAQDGDCYGAISQEYFAQTSQIIPLLLVALGIEARFFHRRLDDSLHRAVSNATIFMLCAGEILTLSTLPWSNARCGDLLAPLHEFAAFTISIAACTLALSNLIVAITQRASPDPM
ncbi:hypothetical protein [Actinoplanes sp. NPDC023714]|uniref:hypothetical protein n=1 Tax=Actinoplanes sp. NPDC023714 TaxID=3154322 RepID=UPI0033E5395F